MRSLETFVGMREVKEAVASHVQEVLSADMAATDRTSPVTTRTRARALRPRRKRKAASKRWTKRKARRDGGAATRVGKIQMVEQLDLVSRAIMSSIRCGDDSDSDYEEDDEDAVESCRPRHLRGVNLHTLLLGAPGTGKTSLAIVLARIWAAVGLVEPGNFCAVTRADLVGKYQGHSSDKVRKLLRRHQNGVVFIDEAYALVTDDKDSFGYEVLSQIVESMTNPTHHVTFIMAGYEKAIKERLLSSNEGLERRFGAMYSMKPPDAAQCAAIFQSLARSQKLTPTFDAESSTAFFREHSEAFRYAGGDLEVLVSHAKRAHVQRRWPLGLNRKLTLGDLKTGFETFARDKQRVKVATVSHLYM